MQYALLSGIYNKVVLQKNSAKTDTSISYEPDIKMSCVLNRKALIISTFLMKLQAFL